MELGGRLRHRLDVRLIHAETPRLQVFITRVVESTDELPGQLPVPIY